MDRDDHRLTSLAKCSCGEMWFELRQDQPGVPLRIAVNPVGQIVGYSGVPYCPVCGERCQFGMPQVTPKLQLVSPYDDEATQHRQCDLGND